MCPVQQSSHVAANSKSHARQGDLFNLIENRRSVRRYQKTKPERSVIDAIISCAAGAPSAHNAQPWRFFIVQDEKIKSELIEQMAVRLRQDLERDNIPRATIIRKTQRSINLFSSAPVLIIAGIEMSGMDNFPDTARRQAEMTMATQSLAAAIQNLLLAAGAAGLSGCWYCAPLFCPDVVKTVLSLPDSNIPQALITLGYPDEYPPAPPRFQLDEIRFRI